MTFTTLTYDGTEKTPADWGIATALRQVSNQAGDNMAFDMMLAADAADPFPYGAKITIQIGRESASVNTINPSLPPVGAGGFIGRADLVHRVSRGNVSHRFSGAGEARV